MLGSGSFSTVVLARSKETGETVALKKVADVLSSQEAARRVLREICILRRVAHPAVIALRDAFVAPSTRGPRGLDKEGRLVPMSLDAYIAMEYAPDGDLFSLRGQLTDGVVADLTAQVASGLAHLHAHGVWHRDIKSANILLARGGDGRRVAKIADFGSARAAVVAEAGPTAAAAMPHADSFAMDVDGDWAAASGDL